MNGKGKGMKLTIETLQAYLRHNYSGRAKEQGLFMKLVEEMGEVAEVLNKRSGAKADDGQDLKAELGNELADMMHYIVAIAAINDLDLERVILEKDQAASVKYHHDINLMSFMEKTEE